jgi:menaquinone-dependent protoporphyrinogen oxidase
MNVLIAYATARGSTEGIAQRIATRLAAGGHVATARPAAVVEDIEPYDAFILGSAVHDQAWLPEAVDFARRYAAALAAKPVWLFSVGSRDSLRGPIGGRMAAHYPEPRQVPGIRAQVRARDHQIFTGVIDREAYPLGARIIMRAMGGRYGDFRDWPRIEAWADEITRALAESSTP